jgi:hypothetical protein
MPSVTQANNKSGGTCSPPAPRCTPAQPPNLLSQQMAVTMTSCADCKGSTLNPLCRPSTLYAEHSPQPSRGQIHASGLLLAVTAVEHPRNMDAHHRCLSPGWLVAALQTYRGCGEPTWRGGVGRGGDGLSWAGRSGWECWHWPETLHQSMGGFLLCPLSAAGPLLTG